MDRGKKCHAFRPTHRLALAPPRRGRGGCALQARSSHRVGNEWLWKVLHGLGRPCRAAREAAYAAADCKTLAWKPGKRPLLEPGLLLIEKPEGLGKVEQPLPKVYAMAEKRHVRQVESKLGHQDRPQEKRTVYRENRIRAADQPAKEVDITTEMTRKARVEDMMTRRNLIDCNCLGDKYYRHPEYMPGFYKAGGLITGSSFHRGMYKKTVPRNSMSMLLLSEGEKRISKSYQEKQAEREVLEAQFEVKALTKSWEHQTLKECDKTFEPADSEDDAPEAGA